MKRKTRKAKKSAKRAKNLSRYVDGFVIPVPRKNLSAYRRMAKLGCKIWLEHGALEYRESVGEDLKLPKAYGIMAFPKMAKAKSAETVIFAWITFKSKAHRNQVNKKVMKDPRMHYDQSKPVFDHRRMAYGGFKIVVSEK